MKKTSFTFPDQKIYMAGHSLGPLSIPAKAAVSETMKEWGAQGVSAWEHSAWFDLPQQIASSIAPLLGTSPENVMVCDTTSVNLYKVLMSALRLQKKRHVILTTKDNFPADRYVAQGIAAFDSRIQVKMVAKEDLEINFDETVAVLLLTEVNYRDASRFDMGKLTQLAHQQGILTVWDLSHSVGMVPLKFDASQADFAVGCTYKYLNGGPGSPAFIAVHSRHLTSIASPILGWVGHENPFAFKDDYHAVGSAHYLTGTPHILSMRSLQGALTLFDVATIKTLYEKSLIFSSRVMETLQELGLTVVTPVRGDRGGHVGFFHPQASEVIRALFNAGIVGDYRPPGLIRICVNPLYLEEDDINRCLAILKNVLKPIQEAS